MRMRRERTIAIAIFMVVLSVLAEAQGRRNRRPDPCRHNPHIITVSPKVLKDRATQKVDVRLPKNGHWEGKVAVHMLIDEDGNVLCAWYKQGHPMLRKAVLEAAKQWTFKPFTLSDVPVKFYGDLELDLSERTEKKPSV